MADATMACAAWVALTGGQVPTRFIVGDCVALAGDHSRRGYVERIAGYPADQKPILVNWGNGCHGAYRAEELELSV